MEQVTSDKIRNLAIIAHVDHGKTTLVDELLKQSGTFRSNEKTSERMMDSMDQERERGITIRAKNTAIHYQDAQVDYKINIVDTPGHADFGGEVERVLQMVDGVVLVVDAVDGPMPQTKFVLRKALSLGHKAIVCINKVDRPNARPSWVLDKVFDLFVALHANDNQLDFPVVYASAKEGYAKLEITEPNTDMRPLFNTMVKHIPSPKGDINQTFQFLATTLDYNDYVGRLVIGKIFNGQVKVGDSVMLLKSTGDHKQARITKLFTFLGLKQTEIESAGTGDIISLAGLDEVEIGDTVSGVTDNPEMIPTVAIDEPTVSMFFMVNNSPFAGKEGKFVTSRHLRDRLYRELKSNVSLRVEDTSAADKFKVSGRGELHLTVLIESMRREGYELAVSKPEVIFKIENGQKMEPMEMVMIDADEEYAGVVIEKMGLRKGEMTNMETTTSGTHLEFKVPSRGLIGYRNEFLTDTRGTGTMNTLFDGYEPYKGEIESRNTAVMVSTETGKTVAFALFNLQERGQLILGSGVECYAGMIIGRAAKDDADMDVNPCKEKKLTNVRNKGAEEAVVLTTPMKMTLERAIEFIGEDELVEVTPESIRLRKAELDPNLRKRKSKVTA